MRTFTKAAVAAAIAFAAVSATATTATADPPEPTPAPAPPPAPKSVIDTDGTFAVNTDIVPGTYSSAGPVDDGACYWKRSDGSGATLDNAITKKAQIVAITPTDAAFKTDGCQAWQLTDAKPDSQLPPQLSGLKMQGYMAILNGMAARSAGQIPPMPESVEHAAPGPAPGPTGTGPAPGPAAEDPAPEPLPTGPLPGPG